MLQRKLIIDWLEFFPLFRTLSFPTAVSSKNVLMIQATFGLCHHFLASAYDKEASNN